MNLTRPAFDAACAELILTPLAITAAQRDALWILLVPDTVKQRSGRPHWTSTASMLREPLRRELNTVAHQRAAKRFAGKTATKAGKPEVDLDKIHAAYSQRLAAILERIDTVMRSNGHMCFDSEAAQAQPIQVIVANERAAGRPAGIANWVQWEDPAQVRKTIEFFAAGPQAKRGANWAPYMPLGTRKRGSAATQRALGVWRGAFHDAIHTQLDTLAQFPDTDEPMMRFYTSLKEPDAQQLIEDACHTQAAGHKTPANPAFKRSIWHALGADARYALAARFHAALRECAERLLARGDRAGAAAFSPAIVPNPFELDEDTPLPAPVPMQDEPPAFDTYQTEPEAEDNEPEDNEPLPNPYAHGQLTDYINGLNDEPEPDQH